MHKLKSTAPLTWITKVENKPDNCGGGHIQIREEKYHHGDMKNVLCKLYKDNVPYRTVAGVSHVLPYSDDVMLQPSLS